MIKKLLLIVVVFFGLISFAQSETSWIKKKDKSEKVEKVEKKKTSNWIKKKEVKKNKKKLKEKIKESKSWITKKSKEKVKDIKEKLKKHKTIDQLPKAEFYFAAIIEPKEDEEVQYIYGYVNSDKSSKKFSLNGKKYFSKSDGIAYFENKENRCEVDSQSGAIGSSMMGEVLLNCKKGLKMAGGYRQTGSVGKGDGVTSNGNNVTFEFYTSKSDTIAKLENYKNRNKRTQFAHSPNPSSNGELNIKPNGKYYALLIGNSKYVNWTSLKSPKNDVSEIEKVLSADYNFEKIITIIDGTEKDIMKGFKKLSNITTDKDYVLIYYSGHGDNRGINNYWIPVDGEKEFGLGGWINTAEISNYIMQEIPNHHIVLMSDSCYFDVKTKSNQILNDRKSLSYQKLLNRRSIMIVQSGSNEPVLDSDDDNHSMFAKSFINSLKNNESVVRMYDIIEEITLSHSGMRQQPLGFRVKGWGDTGGDFLFIAKK